MANGMIRDLTSLFDSSDEGVLDRDALLCEEYDEYIRQVFESGVPLWVLGYYESVSLSSFIIKEEGQPPL